MASEHDTAGAPPVAARLEGTGSRDTEGKFKKGHTGNRGGLTSERRRFIDAKRAAFAEHADEAREALLGLMRSAADERVKLGAACEVLNHGIGKAPAASEVVPPEVPEELPAGPVDPALVAEQLEGLIARTIRAVEAQVDAGIVTAHAAEVLGNLAKAQGEVNKRKAEARQMSGAGALPSEDLLVEVMLSMDTPSIRRAMEKAAHRKAASNVSGTA